MSEPVKPIDLCLADFVTNFIKDIAGLRYIEVGCKLEKYVLPIYDKNVPTNSLNSITDDFYNCIGPKVGSAAIITAEKLGNIIITFAILTTIFMILIVIILGLLDKKQQKGIIIALILFFVIIYIIIGWLLIHNSFLVISNEITNIEQITDNCFNKFITDIEIYFNNQELAIDKALCAYPSTFCNPF